MKRLFCVLFLQIMTCTVFGTIISGGSVSGVWTKDAGFVK